MTDPKPLDEFHGRGITADLERRVAALEAALSKQMAINEAIRSWFEAPGYDYRALDAIRDALKTYLPRR